VIENAFGISSQRWQVLLTIMQQFQAVIEDIIECLVCLHYLMRLRYPTLQNAQLDQEDDDHFPEPCAWRQEANKHEVQMPRGPNTDNIAGKRQRELLKLYFNSQVGSVPWQEIMIFH
jgi:hypothetical protein